MAPVSVQSYCAPTMVLLTFDWKDAPQHKDFLGFTITRTGFKSGEFVLPNRLTFSGPAQGADPPSTQAPIQKFMWWDASASAGETYTYVVEPMLGTPAALRPLKTAAGTVQLNLPDHVENSIGTWFNRAVVSSQAFSALLEKMGFNPSAPAPKLTLDQERTLRTWLADGLETVVPHFLSTNEKIEGAIYHLTDNFWVIPALQTANNPVELVFDDRKIYGGKGKPPLPSPNEQTVALLAVKKNIEFEPRTKTSIMHDKFLVRVGSDDRGERVLCGSANFTPEGFSSQANLLHTFDDQSLASLFLQRKRLIQSDPTIAKTATGAAWSNPVSVGDAGIRVFFSPEPAKSRLSIDTVVKAVEQARSSVVFCLFDPTDVPLLDACFKAGDDGKMMFGLVNHVRSQDPDQQPGKRILPAEVSIYHRSRQNRDIVGADSYGSDTPQGFLPELPAFPGEDGKQYSPVIIHHKFIVIDGETASPIVYTGSANMSNNSEHKNDEVLLEIAQCKRLGRLYLAEFMRLYENYRARAKFRNPPRDLKLAPDSTWCNKYFVSDSPEEKSRIALGS